MTFDTRTAQFLLALSVVTLTACGGGSSSDNVSPGSVVVEVPGGDGGGNGGGNGGGSGGGNGDGDLILSQIPDVLADAISSSGESAADGREIFDIDVVALPGGRLDPAGLLLGNDVVFRIRGGALRVSAQNCTLEIAKGATIVGGSAEDFLVIEQGCRIEAEGTAEQPINFTAEAAIMGDLESNARGLWGGLVINGYAPINDCPEGAQGGSAECTKEGEANSGLFGGDDPEDDSGVLRYVVVSYAGSNVDPENQLNGIAFQGVGSGTSVEYVQVHNNLDDGIEFFGGTVSARYVVLTGNADDSLDWTDGWQGNIQYLYMEQSDSGDNLIEADSREGDENALPRSLPAISNMSGYGNPGENGLRLRRGTGLELTNSFVVDSGSCIQVDGTSRDLLGGDLTIGGSSFACAETHSADDDGAVEAYLDSADNVSQDGAQVDPVTPSRDFFESGFHWCLWRRQLGCWLDRAGLSE